MSFAIVISGCDKYAACWPVLKHSLDKYWPDRSGPTYLISNVIDGPFETIKCGLEKSWAHNLKAGLQQIKESTILLLLDDYWLFMPVVNSDIMEFVSYVEKDILNIRLTPSDESIDGFRDSRLKIMPVTANYPTSLQPSIWNKKFLESILLPKKGYHDNQAYYFTTWAFESEGRFRFNVEETKGKLLCAAEHRYFHVVGQIDPVRLWRENPIVGGEWQKDVVDLYAEEEGIKIDTSVNPKDVE